MFPSLTTSFGDFFAEFEAIQRQLDRLFGLGDISPSIRAVAAGTFPALNMGATDDAVEIYAFAPGLDPSTLEVTVEGNLLTLAGERKSEWSDDESQKLYAQERFAGTFRRVVSLPETVDASKIEASYKNGVLRILLPKHERVKPRRIEVKELEYKG